MTVSTLSAKSATVTIEKQVGATVGFLEAEPLVVDMVPPWRALLEEGLAVIAEEIRLYHNERVAQGKVDHVDRAINMTIKDFDKVLLVENSNNREAPGHMLFLNGQRVSDILRTVMGSKLEMMRGWSDLAKKSPNGAIQEYAPRFEKLVSDADAALKARAAAWQATTEFRTVGHRMQYLDKVNATRKTTWGKLAEMPHVNKGLPGNFADLFFLHDSRVEEPDPTVESVSTLIEDLKAQLEEAQGLLADLKKLEAESEEERKAREAIEAEAEEAERTAQEAQKKADALRAKLRR